jgi:hypothetical protein
MNMTKLEILDALQASRAKLLNAIEGLDPIEMQKPGIVGKWSVRDILAHITRWEAELVRLLFQLKQGQKPDFFSVPEQDIDKINERFYEQSIGRSLDLIFSDLQSVRKQTVRRLSDFSDQEISEAGFYPDLKGNALFGYISSNTLEHEAEHTEQILEWRNRQSGP